MCQPDLDFSDAADHTPDLSAEEAALLALVEDSDWCEEQPAVRPCGERHEWAPAYVEDCGGETCAFRCCLTCGLTQALNLDDFLESVLLARDKPA
jgi:hypothetical protein